MRRLCSVGRHQRRDRVERALQGGEALVSVQRRYDISKSILSRHHRKECGCFQAGSSDQPESEKGLTDELDVATIEIRSGEDVMTVAQRIVGRLDRLAAQAERDGDVRGAVAAIGALNKSLTDLFAKVHGLISDQPILDQRQIVIQQHVAGAPTAGLRALLELLAKLGEPVVGALVSALEGRSADDIERIVLSLAGDAPKAVAS